MCRPDLKFAKCPRTFGGYCISILPPLSFIRSFTVIIVFAWNFFSGLYYVCRLCFVCSFFKLTVYFQLCVILSIALYLAHTAKIHC